VVENIEPELMPALEQAFPAHPWYLEKQREAFAYSFHSEPETTAAERAAQDIPTSLPCRRGGFPLRPVRKLSEVIYECNRFKCRTGKTIVAAYG